MATYKKRGNKVRKPKKDDIKDIEEIQFDGESTTKEVFDTLDETASKSEKWLEENQKIVFSILGVVLLGILAYVAYFKFIQAPKELKAADQLAFAKADFFKAESATQNADSLYVIALNGKDNKFGLTDIASTYSGTKAGNLANYMAGISYLNLGDYKNAVKYLNEFSSDDAVLAPIAKGKLGDAFSDLEQLEDALSYYEEAAEISDNSVTTPLYLLKAGNTAMDLGKYDKALSLFEKIKEKYPNSDEAKRIDVSIKAAKFASK
jgi:TolA-binding protein